MSLTTPMKDIFRWLLLSIVLENILCSGIHLPAKEDENYPPTNQGCVDSKSQFPTNEKIGKKWLQVMTECDKAKKDNDVCLHYGYKRNCPITCRSCPDICEDQTHPVAIKRVDRYCTDADVDVDGLCERWAFAVHCPVTCNFCPTFAPTLSPPSLEPSSSAPTREKGFILIDEKNGLYQRGYMGHDVAIASSGKKIFVAEIDRINRIINIINYSTTLMRWVGPYVAQLDDVTRATIIDVSSDGKNLIVAYDFDELERARVDVYRWNDSKSTWGLRHIITSGSIVEKDFGHSLGISADGDIVLVTSISSVHVHGFNDTSRDSEIPGITGDVVYASMTSDGNMVAVSESSPASIKVFKWEDGRWNQRGSKIEPFVEGETGVFQVVKLTDNGKTLFASTPGMFDHSGAVHVFDFYQDGRSTNWRLRQEGDGVVIKGDLNYDILGRDLSISHDGEYVAWASKTKAGVLKWNGSEWQEKGTIEIVSKNPRVALDPEGNYFAVGLPFKAAGNRFNAGAMLVYKWDDLDPYPSSSPSISSVPTSPSPSNHARPSSTPTNSNKRLPETKKPSLSPSALPSRKPSISSSPTNNFNKRFPETKKPSLTPSAIPSRNPSIKPSSSPSKKPSLSPSTKPSTSPSTKPSHSPSAKPSLSPSTHPSSFPSNTPSRCFHGDCYYPE